MIKGYHLTPIAMPMPILVKGVKIFGLVAEHIASDI